MYSLIIIDDESIIRQGIMQYMPWSELGFQVVATFKDGSEGIEHLAQYPVDVILTDICMTEVSGLAVAEYVHNKALATKVILLSGYKEFEYAKQAIATNVEHYLLKPIAYEEMVRVFTDLRIELDKVRADKEAVEEREIHLQSVLPLLQDHFFADLLAGELADSEERDMRMQHAGLGLSLAGHACCCVSVELLQGKGNSEMGREVYEKLRTALRLEHRTFRIFPVIGRGRMLCLMVFAHKVQTDREMARGLEEILADKRVKLLDHYGITIRWQTPQWFENVEQMATGTLAGNPAYRVEYEVDESTAMLIEMGRTYILQNYDRDLSLNDVAEHVFLNPSYFSRMFKHVTGINFSEFLTQTRLDKAMALIREGNYKIYEISEQVGFSSSKYFATIFRQKTGYSPKAYDRLMKIKGMVERK